MLAQILGAIAGATLVWIHFGPHWSQTPDRDSKLACFCTSPAIRSPVANLVSEIIGTFVLILVASAIGSKAGAPVGPAPGLTPYLIGCLVWGIGLSLGGTTGYAINPARDLGPRIAHSLLPIAQKGGSDWSYAPVPVAGPLIGAALAGLLVRAIGM
jgi:glycerol uptake facilitator protein